MINASIRTSQERRAEQSTRSLQERIRIRTTTLRDGRRASVDNGELMPGNIVFVKSGNRVPADLRLLEYAGMDEFSAHNLLLLLMVLFENMHIFSCRSETQSLFGIPFPNNLLLIFTVFAAHAIHIAAMFTPGLSNVLQARPVPVLTWLVLLLVASTVLVVDDFCKFLRSRT